MLVDDEIGKEAILSYTSSAVSSEETFYTDANGRQFMRRVRNFRPSYNLTQGDQEPTASNYYPVTTGTLTILATYDHY